MTGTAPAESLALVAALALGGVAGLTALGGGVAAAVDSGAEARSAATQAGLGGPRAAVSSLAGLASGVDEAAEAARRVTSVVEANERLPARGAMHGERSAYWSLTREGTLLLGGQRALLLQVADPAVAAGVARFSSFKANPLSRLSHTLDAMATIAFGTPEQRAAMLERLERIHARVKGTTAEGAAYSAMDPELMFWIHATLVDTALQVERRFSGKFSEAERARYYDESRVLARAFGIPEELIPADLPAFERYMADRIAKLRPNAESRDLAKFILRPEVSGIPPAIFSPFERVTRSLLPDTVRSAYGIRRLSLPERLSVKAIEAAARVAAPPAVGFVLDHDLTRGWMNALLSRIGR